MAAGAELLHGYPIWNWGALTVRAVAERAGVNERTVYRYFANERALRDAVLGKLEDEAGVDITGMKLEDVDAFAERIFEYVASFPLEARTPRDPTLTAANVRQRQVLADAVAPHTEGWTAADRRLAAAVLDVLWSVGSYEQLVLNWELEPTEASRALTWVIGLVREAVKRGDRPRG